MFSRTRLDILAGPARNPEMASGLESSGASIVAILPMSLPRFGADASVDMATAQAIRERLKEAKLCLWLDGREEVARLRECLSRLEPDWVALDLRHGDSERLLPLLRSAEVDLVLFGAALDYDEDPAWITERLQSLVSEWSPTAIVLTLLPGLKNPVEWLRSEAGSHAEDVQSSDVDQLLARFPIFLDMELAPADVVWARERFAAARGFAFLAGEARDDGGCPVLTDAGSLASLVASARCR